MMNEPTHEAAPSLAVLLMSLNTEILVRFHRAELNMRYGATDITGGNGIQPWPIYRYWGGRS